MIKYAVRITDDALADMENIYNYIAYELLAPENVTVIAVFYGASDVHSRLRERTE